MPELTVGDIGFGEDWKARAEKAESELEAKQHELLCKVTMWQLDVEELQKANAEVKRLRSLIGIYGWHAENCNRNRLRSNEPDVLNCNCGLDAALAVPKKEQS